MSPSTLLGTNVPAVIIDTGFDYDTSHYAKATAIKQFAHVWAHTVDQLIRSDRQQRHSADGARSWSFASPGRNCNATLQRRWAAGEQMVRYEL